MRVDIYDGNTTTLSVYFTGVTQATISKDGTVSIIRPVSSPDGSQNLMFHPSGNKIVITRDGSET